MNPIILSDVFNTPPYFCNFQEGLNSFIQLPPNPADYAFFRYPQYTKLTKNELDPKINNRTFLMLIFRTTESASINIQRFSINKTGHNKVLQLFIFKSLNENNEVDLRVCFTARSLSDLTSYLRLKTLRNQDLLHLPSPEQYRPPLADQHRDTQKELQPKQAYLGSVYEAPSLREPPPVWITEGDEWAETISSIPEDTYFRSPYEVSFLS